MAILTNDVLFNHLRDNCDKLTSTSAKAELSNFVEKRLGYRPSMIEKSVFNFMLSVKRRWTKSCRKIDKFRELNSGWLQEIFQVPTDVKGNVPQVNNDKSRGRPPVSFSTASERTKRRKIESLVNTTSPEVLSYAARLSLQNSGKRDAAKILKEVTQTSPKRGTKIKNAYEAINLNNLKPIPYSPEEALAFFVDNKLTKNQYISIRDQAKKRNVNIYPSYKKLLEAKKACYPQIEAITLEDSGCEIKLQELLDKSSSRLAEVQRETLISCISKVQLDSIEIIYKWGLDGSSNQNTFKQKLAEGVSDRDLLMISVVPIQLFAIRKDVDEKLVIWQNPRPSSVRYCRPIKFWFCKETPEATRTEVQKVEAQIENLTPTEIQLDSQSCRIKHTLILTMIDGKVCNALTSTSSQVCYICGISPKNINKLDMFNFEPLDSTRLQYGLSTLHAWIRSLECILHIAYRLDIKSWQVKGEEAKEKLNQRKKQITERFRVEMGLIVDQPKQNMGTSNDGNTARRFFENPQLTSDITGVNKDLIERFSIILHALSCGYDLDSEKFRQLGKSTAELFINLYGWYYMPASIHKMLIHGADVIQDMILPIGKR